MEGNDTEPVTEDGTTDWKIVSVAVIILLLSTKVLEGCIMINVPVLDSTSVGIGTVVVEGVSTSVVIETEVEIPLESNTAGVTSNVETLTLSIVSVKIGATDDSTPVVVGVMDKESVERICVVGKAVTKLDNKLDVGILKLDGTSNS